MGTKKRTVHPPTIHPDYRAINFGGCNYLVRASEIPVPVVPAAIAQILEGSETNDADNGEVVR
jgi:hypothetical protein